MKSLLRKGWTQHTSARSASNRIVSFTSKAAVKFCLSGAASRAALELNAPSYERITNIIYRSLGRKGYYGIAFFNDAEGRKKSEILAVVDHAIVKATK